MTNSLHNLSMADLRRIGKEYEVPWTFRFKQEHKQELIDILEKEFARTGISQYAVSKKTYTKRKRHFKKIVYEDGTYTSFWTYFCTIDCFNYYHIVSRILVTGNSEFAKDAMNWSSVKGQVFLVHFYIDKLIKNYMELKMYQSYLKTSGLEEKYKHTQEYTFLKGLGKSMIYRSLTFALKSKKVTKQFEIALQAEPLGPIKDMEKLVLYYKSLGFEIVKRTEGITHMSASIQKVIQGCCQNSIDFSKAKFVKTYLYK